MRSSESNDAVNLGTVVVLDRFLDPIGEEILRQRFSVIVADGLTPRELDAALVSADALYVTSRTADAALISAAKNVRVIGTVGSGTNRVDLAAATARGIPVINAAGAGFKSVAEHAVALMLSLRKRVAQYDRWLHIERRYPEPHELHQFGVPEELEGKVVGIVGLGYIGRDIAEKCRLAFGMSVCGFDPFVQRFEAERQRIQYFRDLTEMLPACDFVVVSAPLNDSTRGLIGRAELSMMQRTAFIIIVSRGGVVEEGALVEALEAGEIAGAGVDVFDPEPTRADHPLFSIDNVVVTPHIAGGTREAFRGITAAVTRQMIEAMDGYRPDNVVNPAAWNQER